MDLELYLICNYITIIKVIINIKVFQKYYPYIFLGLILQLKRKWYSSSKLLVMWILGTLLYIIAGLFFVLVSVGVREKKLFSNKVMLSGSYS
jgi:hypothetical protein